MVTDPISNFINTIKNAGLARKESITLFHSKMKASIADVLKKEGFIKNYSERNDSNKFTVELAYDEAGNSKVHETNRISKPSRRVYQNVKELRPYKNGFGRIVLSTPKGVMSDKDAKKEKVGGEVLFKIW